MADKRTESGLIVPDKPGLAIPADEVIRNLGEEITQLKVDLAHEKQLNTALKIRIRSAGITAPDAPQLNRKQRRVVERAREKRARREAKV